MLPLLVLLMALSGSGASPCKAYWTFIGVKTDCSRAALTALPSGLETSVHFLDVSHNNVSALPNGTFADIGLTQLELLHMDYNAISSVHADAFRDLKVLRTVRLTGNKIRALHPDTFQHNPQLQELSLNHNPLTLPASGPFLRAPLLLVLNLAGCALQSLPDQALQATPSLRALVLAHNRLRAIDAAPFSGSAALVFLDLSDNKLAQLADTAFQGLRGLLRLDMQNNALASVRASTFAPLHALMRLELWGNPLTCNCLLQELWHWAVERNMTARAMCSGGSWAQVQDLQC